MFAGKEMTESASIFSVGVKDLDGSFWRSAGLSSRAEGVGRIGLCFGSPDAAASACEGSGAGDWALAAPETSAMANATAAIARAA
jgi:hypothetical protein